MYLLKLIEQGLAGVSQTVRPPPVFQSPTAQLSSRRMLFAGLVPPGTSMIGLWKVAKIVHFLATFQVHPCAVLTFHESVAQMLEWLGKLVQEPLDGS